MWDSSVPHEGALFQLQSYNSTKDFTPDVIAHSLQAEVKMTNGTNMIQEESSPSIINFRRLETVKLFYKNY